MDARRYLVAALAAGYVLAGPAASRAHGQGRRGPGRLPAIGQTVRIQVAEDRVAGSPALRVAGTLRALTPESVVVAVMGRSGVVAVARARVTRLEVRGWGHDVAGGARRGLVGGAAVGAAFGLLVGALSQTGHQTNWFVGRVPPLEGALGGALLGGTCGLVIGGIVGASANRPGWRSVPDAQLHPQPAASGGQVVGVRQLRGL